MWMVVGIQWEQILQRGVVESKQILGVGGCLNPNRPKSGSVPGNMNKVSAEQCCSREDLKNRTHIMTSLWVYYKHQIYIQHFTFGIL